MCIQAARVNFTYRREREVRQQFAQLILHTTQVRIVPKPAHPAGIDPRLIGIDLPGMKVNDGRLPFLAVEVK
jgi:hypothetical protein